MSAGDRADARIRSRSLAGTSTWARASVGTHQPWLPYAATLRLWGGLSYANEKLVSTGFGAGASWSFDGAASVPLRLAFFMEKYCFYLSVDSDTRDEKTSVANTKTQSRCHKGSCNSCADVMSLQTLSAHGHWTKRTPSMPLPSISVSQSATHGEHKHSAIHAEDCVPCPWQQQPHRWVLHVATLVGSFIPVISDLEATSKSDHGV